MIAGLAGGLASPAYARFTVSPSSLDLHSGGVSLGSIDVNMVGEQAQLFRVDVQDLEQTPSGGFVVKAPSSAPFSAASWITTSPTKFSGAANRTQPIEYAIRVPRNAEPGDHVAAVTIERLPPPGRSQVAAIEAIAVRITIRVPGTIHQAAQIGRLAVPTLAGGGPVTLATSVRNTGNVRLDFNGANRGGLTVLDGSHTAASLPFIGLLYPDQVRSFRLAWQDPPTFGHPEARVAVRLASGAQERSARFWVLPWRQAAALLLVALAVVVMSVQRERRRRAASGAVQRR
ncbi:MAG: hypothetical protein JWN10_598 [Solirubrobacterales bacterium]|nr:hypothetical protein [Solirubrobacterales bacterium]